MTSKKPSSQQLVPLIAVLALSLMLATSILRIQPTGALDSYNATIHDLSFDPQVMCIEKGDTVIWTNNDQVIYTLWFVFSENQSTYMLSDPIPPGETWQHTFDTSVNLDYHSFERLWITGTLKIYAIFGDADGDWDVDYDDFIILAGAYGTSSGNPAYDERADFDGDGGIDYDDFILLAGNYGTTDP